MGISDYLNTKIGDIEPPKTLPIGDYVCQVKKHPIEDSINTKDGGTMEVLRFPCQVHSAIEVDEDELAEFGKVQGVPFSMDFLFSTAEEDERSRALTMVSLQSFFTALGIDENENMYEALASTASLTFGCHIDHRYDKDKDRTYLSPGTPYALD